jgi:acetolactate synthase-1/2/3 large subunit
VLFTLTELAAARDLGLALPVVVWNNSGYGEIRDSMQRVGIPPLGTDASAHDLVAIAQGFGCHGTRAADPDALVRLVGDALAADRPTLIEVRP